MVCQTLELQGYSSQHFPPRRNMATGKCLQNHAIGGSMTNSGVAGNRFHPADCIRIWCPDQSGFDPPVLIAERNFQMGNLFPPALEAEMPRLDDPGMYRPNGNFVDLLAIHPEVIHNARQQISSNGTYTGFHALFKGALESYRLEPRMSFRVKSALFGNFSFEKVGLRTIGRY